MLENHEIRARARAILAGNWGTCAVIFLVYFVISLIIGFLPIAGSIISILVTGPFALGMAIVFLRLARNEPIKVDLLFSGFNDFGRSFTAALLMSLYTLLWTLLLIIPGIIASISYAMTFFILADNPTMSGNDAITASKEMMMGHKWDYFLLQLSFIGWAILCLFTLGIGFLWFSSYVQTSLVVFYHEIKGDDSNVVREADQHFVNVT